MPAGSGTPAARRRKLFSLADELGLDRDERIEISRALLWRDITTWSSLDDAQVDRLLDALEGHLLVIEVYRQRVKRRAVPAPPSDTAPAPGPDRR